MRRSPSFPCPYCTGEDWSYDSPRWVCNDCLLAGRPTPQVPTFEEAFDFDKWYKSVSDNWETANDYITKLQMEDPQTDRDKIIRKARIAKAEEEYKIADDAFSVAMAIKMIKDCMPTGDVYVNVDDIEIRVKW